MLILKEATAAIRRTPLMTVLTTLVIAVTLAVIGVFTLLVLRAQESLDEYRANVPIEAYFEASITSADAQNSTTELRRDPNIAEFRFVSKEEALEEYVNRSGEDVERIVGYNPFPAGVRMTLKDMTSVQAARMRSKLISVSGVKDIIFESKTLVGLEEKTKTLLLLAYLFGGFLIITSLAIVISTARLAITARRETIRTMKLLGAGKPTLILPYIIESVFAGFIGGALAYGLVISFEEYGISRIAPGLIADITKYGEPWMHILGFVVIGKFIGFFGSVFVAWRGAR
jgi:cell division transport system permease protein